MPTIQDVLLVTLSDLHSGSSKALFPNKFWQFEHTNHTPTDEQKAMFQHFVKCANAVKKARQGKRVILVHDGDSLEGLHHGSLQVVTHLKNEQIELHTWLMDWFMREIGWKKGDKLYYVKGTESHTDDNEQLCAEDLGAEPNPKGGKVFDKLDLLVNGKMIMFVHHGPSRGKGANSGNALRAWLRNIFYDCLSMEMEPPHFVITGHTHDPFYGVYSQVYKGKYHLMHGLICPSWQMKTRFAYKVAPVSLNKIGMQFFEITAGGLIGMPQELLMEQGSELIKA